MKKFIIFNLLLACVAITSSVFFTATETNKGYTQVKKSPADTHYVNKELENETLKRKIDTLTAKASLKTDIAAKQLKQRTKVIVKWKAQPEQKLECQTCPAPIIPQPRLSTPPPAPPIVMPVFIEVHDTIYLADTCRHHIGWLKRLFSKKKDKK